MRIELIYEAEKNSYTKGAERRKQMLIEIGTQITM